MLLGGSLFILALSVISLLSARWILQVQDTKPAVIEESMKYLTLIFLGLILNYLYNYFASALRSCGDSRTPFIVLLASSVLHAGLDLLFGWVFRWGIRGVAVSNVISQSGCRASSALEEDLPEKRWPGAVCSRFRLISRTCCTTSKSRGLPAMPQALSGGETARQMVFSVRLASATTRLMSSGSKLRDTHSTEA